MNTKKTELDNLAMEDTSAKSAPINGYFIDEQSLLEITTIIKNTPTQFGFPLITILNNKLIKTTYNG